MASEVTNLTAVGVREVELWHRLITYRNVVGHRFKVYYQTLA